MKRYRLLKDLPNLKKGTILSEDDPIFGINILTVEDNSVGPIFIGNELLEEFFEKIQEEPTDSIHWKPRYNDEYFYISDYGDIFSGIWSDSRIDNERLALGFVYSSEEECEKAKERKLAKVRLQRTSKFKPDFENGSDGWAVCCYRANKELYCVKIYGCDSGEPVHYKTLEEAEKSIRENERDWKIYFGIEKES